MFACSISSKLVVKLLVTVWLCHLFGRCLYVNFNNSLTLNWLNIKISRQIDGKRVENSFKLPTQQRNVSDKTTKCCVEFTIHFLFFLSSHRFLVCWNFKNTIFFFSLRMTRRKTENDYRRLIQCSRWCRRVKKWLGEFVEVACRSFRAANWSSQIRLEEIIEVFVRDLWEISIIYKLKVSNLASKLMTNWCFTWFNVTLLSCVKHRPANLFIDLSCFWAFI
jgi:hypothetical protein